MEDETPKPASRHEENRDYSEDYRRPNDDILHGEKIIAERKTFFLDLISNNRGQVVRITEKVGSNRDRIMVPGEVLGEFIHSLQEVEKAALDGEIEFSQKVMAERKTFFLDLISNDRGQVVRITEKVRENRDRIMVPFEILEHFLPALIDIQKTAQEEA